MGDTNRIFLGAHSTALAANKPHDCGHRTNEPAAYRTNGDTPRAFGSRQGALPVTASGNRVASRSDWSNPDYAKVRSPHANQDMNLWLQQNDSGFTAQMSWQHTHAQIPGQTMPGHRPCTPIATTLDSISEFAPRAKASREALTPTHLAT